MGASHRNPLTEELDVVNGCPKFYAKCHVSVRVSAMVMVSYVLMLNFLHRLGLVLRLWSVMAWYGMVNVDLYSTIITRVSNALNTLVSGETPGF